MNLQKISAIAHKYLSLLVGIQVLFWILSGLFFSVFKIEEVRSEHRMKPQSVQSLGPAELRALPKILSQQSRPIAKIMVEARHEGARVVIDYLPPENLTPDNRLQSQQVLFDAKTGAQLSPIRASQAKAIAVVNLNSPPPVRAATLVEKPSTEYRGPLPAWRIDFQDHEELSLYVTQNTGEIKARRSNLWRTYDALWALHIMDWKDHENFNNGLLILTALLSLVSAIAGIALIPYRINFTYWWHCVCAWIRKGHT